MSSEDRYLEAFKAYYALKQDYENRLRKAKRKILNDPTMSDREKRSEMAKLQPKCINCKKTGGTTFTQDGRNLRATCGHTAAPCKLNIDITRGGRYNALDLFNEVRAADNEGKTDIILAKLDLLFGYTNEETTAEQFEELLARHKDMADLLRRTQSAIDAVADNPDKTESLERKNLELYDLVRDVKSSIRAFEADGSRARLRQAVQTTVDEIMPLAGSIRSLEYQVNSVSYDSDDDTYHLDQLPYAASTVTVDMDEPPIVSSFAVGVKRRAPKLAVKEA